MRRLWAERCTVPKELGPSFQQQKLGLRAPLSPGSRRRKSENREEEGMEELDEGRVMREWWHLEKQNTPKEQGRKRKESFNSLEAQCVWDRRRCTFCTLIMIIKE